ncbi:MAG: hypothetical protein N2746_07905 [Deltaproteobacteria bacterium]|nr:hypothetical protein [Deltaproteobacteria bacterium]
MELAMVSAGILNSIKLKPRNRVIFYIDLSLSLQNNVDILFNSYELAPINLILDSAFPFVCAEYGYAFIRIVQNITEDTKKMRIKRIVSDGAEYQTPTNAKMCVDSGKYDNIGIKERISRFLNRYSKVDVSFSEEDYCIKFSVSISQKGQLQKNALDYLVLFLTENPDLYQDSVKLFEYLRRNVVMNPSGKSLGISKFHPLLRGTEVVLKKVVVNGSICSADIYIRFPFGLDSSALVQKIRNSVSAFNSKEYADIEVYVNAYNPIAVDVNSEVANKLRRAYSDVVGRVDKCVVTDGIYSKLFPNSIGFGPDFSDMAKVNKLAEKDIMQIFNIYLTAMIYLMER